MSIREHLGLSRRLVSLTMREIGAHLYAIQVYPLGLFSKEEAGRPHSHCARNPRPVLLVHGLIHNPSAFVVLKKKLLDEGWTNIYTINYMTRHGSLPQMVADLNNRIDFILKETRSTQIDIVAHSLGGIVSRYYMSRRLGRGKVHHLVTIGTAHKGTRLSRLLKGIFVKGLDSHLDVNSPLIRSLKRGSLPRGSKITSIYTPFDWTVWPRGNCVAEGQPRHAFKNVELDFVGHMGLLYSSKVADSVMQALTSETSQQRRTRVK